MRYGPRFRRGAVRLPELEYGLFPLLALAATRDLIPAKLLFEMIYEARTLVAHEALDLHLINKVVPRDRVLPEAMDPARRIARMNGSLSQWDGTRFTRFGA